MTAPGCSPEGRRAGLDKPIWVRLRVSPGNGFTLTASRHWRDVDECPLEPISPPARSVLQGSAADTAWMQQDVIPGDQTPKHLPAMILGEGLKGGGST